MNSPDRIATSLRHAPSDPTTQTELDHLRAQAWVKRGVICLRPEEISDEWIRAGVVQIVTQKFGKRMSR